MPDVTIIQKINDASEPLYDRIVAAPVTKVLLRNAGVALLSVVANEATHLLHPGQAIYVPLELSSNLSLSVFAAQDEKGKTAEFNLTYTF